MSAPKGNRNAVGNKGGARPSSYRAKFATQAAKACSAGFTDRELADLFGVCERTINTWKVEHFEFSAALKTGKEAADERVERSLYHKAIGYRHEAVKIFCTKDGEIVEHAYVEQFPPSDTACIFWLKNRRPDKWRDRADAFGADVKELMEFTLKLGRAAGRIEERLSCPVGSIELPTEVSSDPNVGEEDKVGAENRPSYSEVTFLGRRNE
jgi:hypothetical protein